MAEQFEQLLALLGRLPVAAVYLIIGFGAAAENVFPPVPSDTAVILGGMLADRGVVSPGLVFLAAWLSNLGLALFVYCMARRYGRGIFDRRWGRCLLRPAQLERMAGFYDRYGTVTVLVSRFFPVFRVLVPAFAGISRLGMWRTALPLAAASALWYALLLAAGMFASRHVPRLLRAVRMTNATLVAIALVVGFLLLLVWWRTRRVEKVGEASGREGGDAR